MPTRILSTTPLPQEPSVPNCTPTHIAHKHVVAKHCGDASGEGSCDRRRMRVGKLDTAVVSTRWIGQGDNTASRNDEQGLVHG
jgi:hypothetical protein